MCLLVPYFRLFQWGFRAPCSLAPRAADRLALLWFHQELTTLTLRMQPSENLTWSTWHEFIGYFCHLSAPSQIISKNFNTLYIHHGYSTHRTPVFIICNIRIRCLGTTYKFSNFIILYCAYCNLFYLDRNVIQVGAKRTHVFQIIVTLFIFNIKNYVNTKTTCNKCSFDYLH